MSITGFTAHDRMTVKVLSVRKVPRMAANPRPLHLALAVALLAVVGAGVAFIGLLLLAVAAGAIPFLAGGVRGFVVVLGAVALASAAMTWVAAALLWMRRPAGWAVSVVVAVSAVAGAVIAVATSGPQLPTLAGLAIGASALGLLVAPETRTAARI